MGTRAIRSAPLRQEVSAVASPSFGTTGSPSFSTREAETTVVVQDGETVLIGGIIDDSISHERSGIPYLMDAPVVGRLFRTDTDSVTRTELLITITPYVIRNRQEARDVTENFTDRIEGLRRLRRAMEAKKHHYSTTEPLPEPAPDGGEAPPQ